MFETCNPTHISSSPISIDKTGPESATTAILYILDIFGFCPQVLQVGIPPQDLPRDLSQLPTFVPRVPTSSPTPTKVPATKSTFPTFFHGEPYSAAEFPLDTPEKGAKLGTFFQGAGTPPKTVATIPSVIKDIEAKAGGKIEKWGVVGMCWGGKVCTASARDTCMGHC